MSTKHKAKLIPALGGGKEDPPQLLWEVMLFNALTVAEAENALAYAVTHPDEEAAPTDDARALVQQMTPAAFLASEREYVRDAIGRFGEGDGDTLTKEPKADRAAQAAKLADLSTRTDFGDADPPSGHPPTRDWGRTEDSTSFDRAHAEAVALVGANVEMATASWSYGTDLQGVRDSYASYRESGSTADPEVAEDWSSGAQGLFEMIDANRIDAELHRGQTVVDPQFIESLRVGETLPDGIASWSRDPAVGEVFRDYMAGRASSNEVQVQMRLEPGAHGVDIAALGAELFAWQEEVIVGGPLTVTSVERGEGPYGAPLYTVGVKAAT